ncbi:MAG: prolipoprotein diacylglyceryl transferase family protein [Myxococcota bacterium]
MPIPYAVAVVSAFIVGGYIRRREGVRLGYVRDPRYRWVGLACLLGAVLGAKLGMLFYLSVDQLLELGARAADLRFDGKTVLGAITGGYIAGELAKKALGVRYSTGDALAVALPVGQAIGRLGCFFTGCCFGAPCELPWSVAQHDALRHPVQLYESAACLALAGWLWSTRTRPRRAGFLFRYYLIGYAAIRFSMEFFRGEPQRQLGPLSYAQVYCLIIALVFAVSLRGKHGDATMR